MDINYGEGEVCGRDGCTGHIKRHEVENCSCHISPPCGACTSPLNFCPECDWEEADDPTPEPPPPTQAQLDAWKGFRDNWKRRTVADLDGSKIEWVDIPHNSTCSMIKEGKFPAGTTMEELRKAVDGTFGGVFQHLRQPENGKPGYFKFLAYTD